MKMTGLDRTGGVLRALKIAAAAASVAASRAKAAPAGGGAKLEATLVPPVAEGSPGARRAGGALRRAPGSRLHEAA